MSQQVINIGSAPNDGTGDQLRTAFDKSNDNFTELYEGAGNTSAGLWNFNQSDTDTSMAPVSGRFKTNSGNYHDATQIAIHGTTIQGISRANRLRTLLVGDIVQCQDSVNDNAWCRYVLQSPAVDNSSWFQLDVALDTDGGAASGDNQEVIFNFTANTSANGGGNVSNVGTPTNGQLAQWTDATHIQGVAASTITTGFAPLASPTFTGDPKAPTATAGDNDTSIATTGFVTTALAAAGTVASLVPGCGRLEYVSATQLVFKPFAGNKIKTNGTVVTIPTAGMSCPNTNIWLNNSPNQNLAANTTYWLFAWYNAGVLVPHFWTTAGGLTAPYHAPSTTAGNEGVETWYNGTFIDTYTLIGMCRTNASSQFVDSVTNRLVRSWFNRGTVGFANSFTAARSTTSTSAVEVNSEIRCNFLAWSDEVVSAGVMTIGFVNASGVTAFVGIGWDGALIGNGYRTGNSDSTAAQNLNYSHAQIISPVSEGFHYVTIMGNVASAATLTLGGSPGGVPTFTTLTGHVA